MLESKTNDGMLDYIATIINTVREPLIILDQDLRVITVNRSFYTFFKAKPENIIGQQIFELDNKQWDIPVLRELLETILPQRSSFDDYKVEHDFANIGRRVMLLNARQMEQTVGIQGIILLAMEDITWQSDVLSMTKEENVKWADELVIAKEKIFDPFFTTKGQLGSGLNIVYGFVQNSGGVIDAYSVMEEGTEFTFYFPRYHGPCNEEKPEIETPSLANVILNDTILIVDDEPDLLEVTHAILTSHGFTVFCAADATEALSILEHESMDIVISDVIMPRIDGYQLAAIVKQKYPDTKIQLVSGFSGHRNVEMANIDLQQNLLRKPVKSQVLLERIRKLLDEKI
jgi:PAS domain S-box-containing protein